MTSASFLVWERRTTAPSLVFDLVDELLAERRTADRRTRPRGGPIPDRGYVIGPARDFRLHPER